MDNSDQYYKEELLRVNRDYPMFIDMSVDTGDISDDQTIRRIIRDQYLKESTVTILLAGVETKTRKHIDWEIYSSMIDGAKNKKSGILVINLPETNCTYYTAPHAGEKDRLYPDTKSWTTLKSSEKFKERYPHLSDRMIDNLLKPEAKISVVNWSKIAEDIDNLEFLIDAAFKDRAICHYDFSSPMRRKNSS